MLDARILIVPVSSRCGVPESLSPAAEDGSPNFASGNIFTVSHNLPEYCSTVEPSKLVCPRCELIARSTRAGS